MVEASHAAIVPHHSGPKLEPTLHKFCTWNGMASPLWSALNINDGKVCMEVTQFKPMLGGYLEIWVLPTSSNYGYPCPILTQTLILIPIDIA
jgi:hypothetical protein